jgi:hypothetical protein
MVPACFRLWFSLAVIAIMLTACGDYSIRLPHGYGLTQTHGGTVLIEGPDHRLVVGANVDGYGVLGDLVVGHVSLAEYPPDQEDSRPGYFILNTKRHEVKEAIEKNAWLDALRAAGVSEEPRLSKPSRFDKNY